MIDRDVNDGLLFWLFSCVCETQLHAWGSQLGVLVPGDSGVL